MYHYMANVYKKRKHKIFRLLLKFRDHFELKSGDNNLTTRPR